MYWWLRIPLHFILRQVSTVLLNWKPAVCWLLTWGPGSNVQREVWGMAVKLGVRTLFPDGCPPQALGSERVGRNCLVCCVFQIRWEMPVFLRSAKETRRRCLLHRMWVFQLLGRVVFPKAWTMFRWLVCVSPKTTRCLNGWTISCTCYQCNLGKAI